MRARKKWNDYYLTTEQAEELEVAYVVFEEDDGKRPKAYDLTLGIFADLETAKEYAEHKSGTEKVYVAVYKDYIEGFYDYLHKA